MSAQTEEQEAILQKIEGTYQLADDYGYSYVRIFENLNATKEDLHAQTLAFFPYLVMSTYDARKVILHESAQESVIVAKVAYNELAVYSNLAHFYIVPATRNYSADSI